MLLLSHGINIKKRGGGENSPIYPNGISPLTEYPRDHLNLTVAPIGKYFDDDIHRYEVIKKN